MDDDYREALARPRAAAALGMVFGLVALLAAAGGLFSVLSAAVARRQREFGIRVALGLAPVLLARLVLKDALRLAVIGLGAGLLGAWMLGRGLAALTYEVSAADPQSLAGVCATLTLSIVVASWRPALRAARVDPVALFEGGLRHRSTQNFKLQTLKNANGHIFTTWLLSSSAQRRCQPSAAP